jgi:hypothetical protein
VQANTKVTNSFHFSIYSVKALRQGRALRAASFIQNKIKRERERETEIPCSGLRAPKDWWLVPGGLVVVPWWLGLPASWRLLEAERSEKSRGERKKNPTKSKPVKMPIPAEMTRNT